MLRREKRSGDQRGEESKRARGANILGEYSNDKRKSIKKVKGSRKLWRIKRIEISLTFSVKSFILHLLHSMYGR